MKELTKEQKEYIRLKSAFERMSSNLQSFMNKEGNRCLPIYKSKDGKEYYKVEVVFENLLDLHK